MRTPCGLSLLMPYLAPDVWTLDADFWLARLRRQPPADGAKARLTDALAAVDDGPMTVAQNRRRPWSSVLSARRQVTGMTVYNQKDRYTDRE